MLVALQPSSSSHDVPGRTTSAKRRAVSFQKSSWLTIRSWRASAASTRALSANDESMSVPKSSSARTRPVSSASVMRGIWFGT